MAALFAVLLILAIFIPNPAPLQYIFFRTSLALIAACWAAVFLKGTLRVKFGNWLSASGALGAFVIVYFLNPASSVIDSADPKTKSPKNISAKLTAAPIPDPKQKKKNDTPLP